MRIYLFITAILLLALRHTYPEPELRLELHDGSILHGSIAGENSDSVVFQTAYGTLEIPREQIRLQTSSAVNHIVHETWWIAGENGDAKVRMLVPVPGLSEEKGTFSHTVPLFAGNKNVRITRVSSPNGTELEFRQQSNGAVVLLMVHGETPPESDALIVEAELRVTLRASENGKHLEFHRSHTPANAGRLYIEVNVPPGWTPVRSESGHPDIQGSTVRWRKSLKRQEAHTARAVFAPSSRRN